MSWKATAYVKDLVRTPSGEALTVTEKLVLFILADDHHLDAKATWPSVRRLAERAMVSERYVSSALKSLERKKVLAVLRGRGRGNLSAYSFLELDDPAEELDLQPEKKTRTEFTFSQNTLELQGQDETAQQVAPDEAVKGEKPELSSPFTSQNAETGKGEKGENKTCKTGTSRHRYKEGTGLTGIKTSAADAAGGWDVRHEPIREAVKRLQRHLLGAEFWDGGDAKALSRLLDTTNAGVSFLVKCLVFRALSPDTPFSELPKRWLRALLEYADGPMDRYRKRAYYKQGSYDTLFHVALGNLQPKAAEPERPEEPVLSVTQVGLASWGRVLERLEGSVNSHTFDTWLKPTRGVCTEGATLVVSVPNADFEAGMGRFAEHIQEAMRAEGLALEDVRFVVRAA